MNQRDKKNKEGIKFNHLKDQNYKKADIKDIIKEKNNNQKDKLFILGKHMSAK